MRVEGVVQLALVGHLPVSAASGLVQRGGELYVVADDEVTLVGTQGGTVFDRRISLLPDVLPEAHDDRKRAKPDFEALTELPDGRLLALGSGSTSRRMRAVLVDLTSGVLQVLDCEPLFTALGRELPDLNVEGVVVHRGRLVLAQRGNGAAGVSALVSLDLDRFLDDASKGVITAAGRLGRTDLDLGSLHGVRLTPTDLASDGERIFFSAAAEAGDSTYLDGEIMGSVVGRLALDLTPEVAFEVEPRTKLEGLALGPVGAGTLFCVSDPDDRSVKAPLYRVDDPRVAAWFTRGR